MADEELFTDEEWMEANDPDKIKCDFSPYHGPGGHADEIVQTTIYECDRCYRQVAVAGDRHPPQKICLKQE
jgi:hypothetical protein